MALTENLDVFLADFGVSVTAGAVSGIGILDMPGELVADGMIITTDYSLRCEASKFSGLIYGAAMTIDGVNYQVRENRLIEDGAFCEITLLKVAADSSAVGQDPRTFGLNDLSDVTLTSPAVGEVLKYNGSQWVDGQDQGTAYVWTQSAPAITWTIAHNLGHVPSVEIFDSGSQEIEADVSHPSVNVTIILFSLPIAGFARLI
jgi:hypothetical protein